MDWNQIIWVASYPKSGNTWLRCLLDAYLMGEVDINELVTTVSDDNGVRATIGDGRDILKEPIEVQMLAKSMAMIRLVSAWEKDRIQGVPLFVKTHAANLIVNGHSQIPECLTRKAVYVVRDPRKVFPSFATHMGLSLDDALEAMEDPNKCLYGKDKAKLPEVVSSWEKHVRSFVYADAFDVMIIKYEDLKENTAKIFSEMLEFAEMVPDMPRIKRAIELTELSKLKKQEDEKGFKEASEFSKGFFGRKHAAPEQRHLYRIEKKHHGMMKTLGYKQRKAS